MTPTTVALEIKQGTTYTKPFTLHYTTQDTSGITNVADLDKSKLETIDLTGYTARMQLRSSIEDPNVELELTTENGRIIIDGPHGKITLYVTDDITSSLTIGSYYYDLEIISGSGEVSCPIKGKAKVTAEVTR